MSLISNAPALRRRACALALPGIPLALLAATLVSPTESIDNAVQLRAAAAHAGRWQAAALLELLTAALFPLAAAGIVHLVRRRGSALAHVGAVAAGLGTLGMTSIALRHLYIYGLTAADRQGALHALDRLDNHAGAIAFPLMVAAPLAWILLAGAAARAGLAPRWVVAGMIAFAISRQPPDPGRRGDPEPDRHRHLRSDRPPPAPARRRAVGDARGDGADRPQPPPRRGPGRCRGVAARGAGCLDQPISISAGIPIRPSARRCRWCERRAARSEGCTV